jgi:hypothetical protein
LRSLRSSTSSPIDLKGRDTIEEVVDEQIVTQVEGWVLVEESIKLEAQHVFAHTESLNYVVTADVYLTTSFITTIAVVVASQEEGDNGHT